MVTDTCMRSCLISNHVLQMYIDPIVNQALQATSASNLQTRLQQIGIPGNYINIALQCYNQCSR